VCVMLAVRFATEGRGYGPISPSLAGLIASAAAAAVVLALRRPRAGL
jgi:hypothetical protein